MTTLADADPDAGIDCPPEIGHAIKRLAADPAHRMAWEFIVEILCGTDRLSFAIPDDSPSVMGWRAGRRYVGLTLRGLVAKPILDDDPKLPPARTATETARRRNTSTSRD